MIRQDDRFLKLVDSRIERWGCAALSVFFWVEQLKNLFVGRTEAVVMIEQGIQAGALDDELTVSWAEFFGIFGVKVSVRFEKPDYICKKNEFEILELEKPGHTHFVPGDGQGNWVWDPLGRYRPGVENYRLKSKRVFKEL